jgi:hypothetical protein
VHRDRQRGDLHNDMRGSAEGTIRPGDISLWMCVNKLNGSAGNDQHDAEESEEKSPRRRCSRIRSLATHVLPNIAHSANNM